MPKLSYSSEKWGCGATIELDNKDVVIVSIDRGEVLVRQSDIHQGLLKAIIRIRTGPALYRSKNRHKNAKTAEALDLMFRQKVPALSFRNPVLIAFAKAVWHCLSAEEVENTLRSCEPPPQEQWSSSWDFTDESSFYTNALRPDWKKIYIERGSALYTVIFSDDKKTKKFLTKNEVTTWPAQSNELFEAENKPYRIVRLANMDGDPVWERRKNG